ncbi:MULTISPECIES: O-acetylhomoserine aminocarboxypropyltransferase/cysteine synthase family protein [Actinomycetes]|uniref:O-acetylhomoserine aminocarboxypropyltransferase/cysteine synthase n=2 Tax=Actinomycetes TaxID=1760 RepID=A0ABP6M4Z6_9MICC|nr:MULTISPECIES: O-acetylhomoserine aminocarboxypropyltransferase/cysteine synthase family protein [unclassified Nesterenkonia]MDS2172888.1 O-acetylhomoserine aminocarboxypropyltransferase/cysteine synthase [Nesterenkonia sp. CL21]OSM42858.1 O-acetylhomoserine aminocarboxypropyltransferase [Nesterenkonia sp. PF2B19]
MSDRQFGFRTRALHAGAVPDAVYGTRAVPIHQSTSFVFKDTDDAANLFALQKFGNIYSRIGNPTVAALEERLASLEGGIGAVATASGMSAEFLVFAALCGQGDHIVASSKLYGGTITQLDVSLRRFGIETTFVDSDEAEDFKAALQENTKLIFTEVVTNPSSDVVDLPGLAGVAHEHGIPLVVDSTLTTPYLLRPIEHGADIVTHSVTKFLGGHGTTLGGVIVESGTFPWNNGKFPQMTEPVESYGGLSWWGNFAEYGFLTKIRAEQLRDFGPSLTPQAAFQLIQGVETLPQRMEEHTANAQKVAEWLEADERVEYVNHSGLPSHPHHERAKDLLPLGTSSVFSFGVRGGRETGARFIEELQLASHLANVGDARTLVLHPASTTHQQLTQDQLTAAGIPEDLIRISVGLEDVEDIIWDLDQALDRALAAQQEAPAVVGAAQNGGEA